MASQGSTFLISRCADPEPDLALHPFLSPSSLITEFGAITSYPSIFDVISVIAASFCTALVRGETLWVTFLA